MLFSFASDSRKKIGEIKVARCKKLCQISSGSKNLYTLAHVHSALNNV